MKVTTSWLKSLIEYDCDDTELVEIFNSLGLEVDAYYRAPVPFSNVVVGRVEKLERHPQRTDLWVCDILVDRESNKTVQVVCGDQTLKENERVVLARDGAKLPDGRIIKKTTIQGVESNGMLCSGKELAISSNEETVWRMERNAGRIGECPGKTMLWDDSVLDLDLTPNRGDCFSVLGLARELQLITNKKYQNPLADGTLHVPQGHHEEIPIEVHAPEACPIYHGIVIKNVPQGDAHLHRLRKDLICCGLRPVNYVVDCLNYELLETGQPTHAFDLETVKDGIVVRFARQGEKILLLDGTNVKLDPSVLIIASGEKPVAIAGVMGSLDSAVTEKTKDILLEVAYFTPDAVRGTARMYGLQSEASVRFERGVDYSIQAAALKCACQRLAYEVPLNSQSNGGLMQFGPVISVVSEEHLPERPEIFLPKDLPEQRIGHPQDLNKINRMFDQLEFKFREEREGWWITPPPHRYDIEIPEDFVEEICRVVGYDNIPSTPLQTIVNLREPKRKRGDARELRTSLSSLGYNEVITYSFIPKNTNDLFSNSKRIPELVNPISVDRAVMRGSIISGLLTTVAYNIARQEGALRLFEYGQCFRFVAKGKLQQRDQVAGVLLGTRSPESWANDHREVDFFDIKADLESLLCFATIEFEPVESKGFEPNQCASVKLGRQVVGVVGKVRSSATLHFEIEQDVYAFELDAENLLRSSHPRFVEFSSFPSVRRDLALVLDESVTVRQIEAVVEETLGDLLWDFVVFDVFGSSQFEENQHSIAIGITLRHPSRTLQDEEVNSVMNEVVQKLSTQFHAKLRT